MILREWQGILTGWEEDLRMWCWMIGVVLQVGPFPFGSACWSDHGQNTLQSQGGRHAISQQGYPDIHQSLSVQKFKRK